MSLEIHHEETLKEGSFYTKNNGKRTSELEYRKIDASTISAYHTEVYEDLQGEGVGKRLYEELIRTARERGWKIQAQCPFVRKMMRRDPSVHDLMVG